MATSFVWEGASIGGEPSRVERDFESERRADRISYADLLKEMRWTAEDVETARGYGFPVATNFEYVGRINPQRQPVYSRRKIEQWREAFLAFAAKVK
jgi:hypothetical protein